MARLYSSGEAATRLGLSRDKVQRYLKKEGAPSVSMAGGKYAMTEEEVDRLGEFIEGSGEQQ